MINLVATAAFSAYFTSHINLPDYFPLEAVPSRNPIPRTKPILPPKTLHQQGTKNTG